MRAEAFFEKPIAKRVAAVCARDGLFIEFTDDAAFSGPVSGSGQDTDGDICAESCTNADINANSHGANGCPNRGTNAECL